MFYEFALEPAVITGWERARYFLEGFGASRGRFLAKLPKTWARAVLEGATCGDVEKKRIETKLEQLVRNRAFSTRVVSDYPAAMAWAERARAEHAKKPFRAIVGAGEGAAPFISAERVSDDEPLWRVEQGQFVSREPGAFATALGLLIGLSKQLVVIDPHFRANRNVRTEVLAVCAAALGPGARVDVHAALDYERAPSYAAARSEAETQLPPLIPAGLRVSVSFWNARSPGQRLHNRYVITDVGGVQFGDSIERGGTDQVDRLSILEEESRARIWNDFMGGTPAFDRAGAGFEVVGTRRR